MKGQKFLKVTSVLMIIGGVIGVIAGIIAILGISALAALVRIDNKTYGICRATGKLIPKERLRAVPHATLCVEEKQNPNH